MPSLRRFVSRSNHPIARAGKRFYYGIRSFTLPAPRPLIRPLLWVYLGVRNVYYFLYRVLVCEPFFKAYCSRYGRGVRTGVFIHWIMGNGEIHLGDQVLFDGKTSVTFSSQFTDRPVLEVGDRSEVGHGCSLVIGKRITIGRDVRISLDCILADSNGHPMDAEGRRKGLPPHAREVRPIVIGDDVWIGRRSIILPGTRIGEGAIVAAGSVVRGRVEPYTVVGGNPAQVLATLSKPSHLAPPTNPAIPVLEEGVNDDQDRAAPAN